MPTNNRRLDRFIGLCKVIREVDAQLPAQSLHVLFCIARNPGITMQGIAENTGLGLSSVSRNIMALGQWHRAGKPGYNLVEAVDDPVERRRKIVFLTQRGREFVRDLLSVEAGEKVDFESPTAHEGVASRYARA